MKKIKFKLSYQELVSLCFCLQIAKANMADDNLTAMAKQELNMRLFLRLTAQSIQRKQKQTLTLSMPEAWAFYETMQHNLLTFEDYEQIVLGQILNEIHRISC